MSSPQHIPLSVLAKEFVRYLALNLYGDAPPGICIDDGGRYSRGDTVRVRTAYTFDPTWGTLPPDIWSVTETTITVTLDHLWHEVEIPLPIPGVGWQQVFDRYFEPLAQELVWCLRQRWPPGATLVTAALETMRSWTSHVETHQGSGLSVRFAVQYASTTDTWRMRVEMLYGFTGQKQTAAPPVKYMPTAEERDAIALLTEARDEWVKQLERIRAA